MQASTRVGLFVAKKQYDEAKKLYAQAAQEEKAVGYYEPPAYIRPVAETEAAFLAASDWTGAKAGAYGLKVGLIWWSIGMLLAAGYFTFVYRSFAGKVVVEKNGHG